MSEKQARKLGRLARALQQKTAMEQLDARLWTRLTKQPHWAWAGIVIPTILAAFAPSPLMHVLVASATIVALWIVWHEEWRRLTKALGYVIVVSIGVVLSLVVIPWIKQAATNELMDTVMRAVQSAQRPPAPMPPAPVPKPSPPVEAAMPVIEPSYNLDMMGLPIIITPYGMVEIIRVRQDRTVEMVTVKNPQDRPYSWPTAEQISPPESVGVIQIANHGNVGAYNIAYSIRLDIGSIREVAGVKEVPFVLPIFNLPSNSPPKRFYVVNQSAFGLMVRLSDRAAMNLQGEEKRRTISLKPRDLAFFDKIPTLFPSKHEWQGDTLPHPDMWAESTKPKENGDR